jgi:hypothetical protein
MPRVTRARDEYIATQDPSWAGAVRALDAAVMAGGPDLTSRISYRMLMYTLGTHKKHWVCAIGTTSRSIVVRFLYGVMLDDPHGRLRAGSSTLQSLDFATPGEVDAQLVTEYVAEAVAKFDAFLASQR